MYDYGARWLDPTTGLWTQPDTMVPQPGDPKSLNRYAYGLGNPLRYADPTGHSPAPVIPPGWWQSWTNLRVDISGWSAPGKVLASVGCFVAGCHVDWEKNVLSGPSRAELVYGMMIASPMSVGGHLAQEGGEELGRRIPLGFRTPEAFAEFGSRLKSGLGKASFGGTEALFQGSSVTGVKYTTSAPFDVGRVSDFDIALAGSDILNRAAELGVELRSRGTRTGPLAAEELDKLGLTGLRDQLSKLAGREVNFMIFQSVDVAC